MLQTGRIKTRPKDGSLTSFNNKSTDITNSFRTYFHYQSISLYDIVRVSVPGQNTTLNLQNLRDYEWCFRSLAVKFEHEIWSYVERRVSVTVNKDWILKNEGPCVANWNNICSRVDATFKRQQSAVSISLPVSASIDLKRKYKQYLIKAWNGTHLNLSYGSRINYSRASVVEKDPVPFFWVSPTTVFLNQKL